MTIRANQEIIVVRFNEYRNYDFIAEHAKIIDREGYSWMLKLGRKIPSSSLERVIRESRTAILKAPKTSGGKYYVASLTKYHNGLPEKDAKYPAYYSEMLASQRETDYSLDGTWLVVNRLLELPSDGLALLKLVKNEKLLSEVVNHTRTSVLYVRSDADYVL